MFAASQIRIKFEKKDEANPDFLYFSWGYGELEGMMNDPVYGAEIRSALYGTWAANLGDICETLNREWKTVKELVSEHHDHRNHPQPTQKDSAGL